MNDLEQQLNYPLGDALPDIGHSITVAPGVKWIRMSLPFVLNHINLWLLRDEIGQGVTQGVVQLLFQFVHGCWSCRGCAVGIQKIAS